MTNTAPTNKESTMSTREETIARVKARVEAEAAAAAPCDCGFEDDIYGCDSTCASRSNRTPINHSRDCAFGVCAPDCEVAALLAITDLNA